MLPLPFELKAETLDRMLNFEIADHPIYSGLEIQGFDDDEHGRGMVVFVTRRERDLTDVYYESTLKLDQKLYGVGGGLGLWLEWKFDRARLSIGGDDDAKQGIDVDISFNDIDGRLIQVLMSDPTPVSRRCFSEFLAPVGAAIVHPKSLLLVWMSQFDLFYRCGPTPVVSIERQIVTIGQLPMEWLLRRRLIKVASDLFIVRVNPVLTDEHHSCPEIDPENATVTVEGLESIRVRRGMHVGQMEFTPAFPDLLKMKGDATKKGRWATNLDGTSVAAGSWSLEFGNTAPEMQAEVVLEIDQGWKPQNLASLMRFVTWIGAKIFRQWPTTYKYTATVCWNPNQASKSSMVARWDRRGSDTRGEAYQAMMKTNDLVVDNKKSTDDNVSGSTRR